MVHLIAVELTLAFVVFCADSIDQETPRPALHRLVRALCWPVPGAFFRGLFWPKALAEYLRDPDGIKVVHASVTVWILLITGWLLGLLDDRVVTPLVLGS